MAVAGGNDPVMPELMYPQSEIKIVPVMAAAASLYGVKIVTDQPDSPHLLVDKIKGELYYAFAEHDAAVPDHVIPDLKAALAKTDVKNTIKIFPNTHHGFAFPQRWCDDKSAAERHWERLLVCLFGFFMASLFVKRLTRPSGEELGRRGKEASDASYSR